MRKLLNWFGKHKFISSLLTLLLAAVIFFGRTQLKRSDQNKEIGKVEKGTILESVFGIGTVTATKSYQLRMGVASTIRKIFVREGDFIKKGDKLVDFEGSTIFKAPFDGTITFLPVKVGETVFPQTLVLNLVDLSDRYILVSLEQRGAIHVQHGQKTKISFDTMREKSYEGVVESLYSNDNSFFVRVGVSGLPPQILPGMTADVAIAIGEHANALLVPVAAINSGKVYLKRGMGKTEAVSIQTGVIDGAMAEVISGDIKEGDSLFIEKKTHP